MSNWQDISTAPKDGTKVRVKRVCDGQVLSDGIAYFGSITIDYGMNGIAVGMQYPATQTYGGVWVRDGGRYLFPDPTHWMPPAKPG